MTVVLHLVIGPTEHGVVRHGLQVAKGCVQRTLHVDAAGDLGRIADVEVVHLPFTDRLFGHTLATARHAFDRIADLVDDAGASLSVTLHDVPHDDSPLQQRRRGLYAHVISRARGVVVNSDVELALVTPFAEPVHSLRRLPLPVDPCQVTGVRADEGGTVAVLGYIYPDRGHEDVIAALPERARLLLLGRASDGHEELVDRLAGLAGDRLHVTGYLPDAVLAERLAAVRVPVAPNRRVTASASINTWLAHGRRPLVADSPYARELDRRLPGCLTRYDPGDRFALHDAIEHALADPASTYLDDDTHLGPTTAQVAVEYRGHLEACRPPRAHDLGGTWLVPANRWDLVPPTSRVPTVSVVIPYYEAQHDLDLVLTALGRQTHPPDRLEVCVVDDGSPTPPDVDGHDLASVRVIAQPDQGFRAARARNLGAAATTGEVLVFLDADTVPEPAFVAELAGAVAGCGDTVAVGRRRHADLADVTPDRLRDLWAEGRRPEPLPEPQWLIDAYRRSADLLRVDRRSYRFVISAVLAMSRRLFDDIGGFDERFVGYGGEDWELAHRAYVAGAVLRRVPSAVAWHDGPDFAARGDASVRDAVLARQTARLAELLPDPEPSGRDVGYPSVVVTAGTMTSSAAHEVTSSAFAAGADCAFWFAHIDGAAPAGDRVHVGAPPADVLARAWCRVRLHRPRELGDLMRLAERADRHGRLESPELTVQSARAVSRLRRWAAAGATGLPDAEVLFGRHDLVAS